ncbi:MAG: YggT family protein [Anaerolineales bacterium]
MQNADAQPPLDAAVDRREETVTTQEPGYATTQRIVRDVAAERRMNQFQVTRLVWAILALLEVMLGLRFLLKLLGANAASGFGSFTYGLTGLFVAPFNGLLSNWTAGSSQLEVTTLVAMAIYALIFWGIIRVLAMLLDRGGARTVTRTTREQTPGGDGNERTTRTISRD